MIISHQSTVLQQHGIADVWFSPLTNHHSLHAAKFFIKGGEIVSFSAGTVQNYPTYLTLQTGIDRHITLKPDYLQFVNHSCDPTAFFDTECMKLICIQSLRPGDEITFFYPSTEWKMAQPFICNCGHPQCLQIINGAAGINPAILQKYRLTRFIEEQLGHKV